MPENRQFLDKSKNEMIYGREISPPHVDTDKCIGCWVCVYQCPENARVLRKTELRSVFIPIPKADDIS